MSTTLTYLTGRTHQTFSKLIFCEFLDCMFIILHLIPPNKLFNVINVTIINVTIINVVLIPLLMLISQIIEQPPETSHSLWNVNYHNSAFDFDLREYGTFVTSLVYK